MKLLRVRLLVLVGVLSVSFAAILVKLSSATALHNAFYRMFFSTVMLLPFLYRSKKDFKSVDTRSMILMILSGIALGLHFFTWFISLDHTSIANSMVLICLSPIFTVSGGALIFGTKFKAKEILMTLTAIAGSIIMALHTGQFETGELYGNLMALLGAFLIAVYLLIGRYVRRKVSTTIYTFCVYCSASVSLGLIALMDGVPLHHQAPRDWVIFLLLALFPTLMGHSLFSYALKYVKAAYISTAVLFEPVLSILLAMLIFGYYPDKIQIIGGSIILLSLIVHTVQSNSSKSNFHD